MTNARCVAVQLMIKVLQSATDEVVERDPNIESLSEEKKKVALRDFFELRDTLTTALKDIVRRGIRA